MRMKSIILATAVSCIATNALATNVTMNVWSTHLSNISTVAQTINLGPAPSNQDYQLFILNATNMTNPNNTLEISVGTSPDNPTNILSNFGISEQGFNNETFPLFERNPYTLTLPAGANLYLKYWDSNPASGESADIDLIAYPTAN